MGTHPDISVLDGSRSEYHLLSLCNFIAEQWENTFPAIPLLLYAVVAVETCF
jgi:hypothetical protein